ncbi:MAG TPA: hypothetical protein QGF58_22870 [Myxococcota bacterium]|nr:hypothetical protein [Myxococcota bacterium]
MLWLVSIACFGDSGEETDPWAPPPLPEDLEAPGADILGIEELVGATIEPAQVGDWIGQANDDEELRRRLAAADLVVVRSMTLRSGVWTPEAVGILAEAASLGQLENFDAGGALLGVEGGVALAKAPWLANLERLVLAGADLGDRGFSAICDEADLRRVKDLDLRGNSLTAAGVTILGDGPFGKLERLDLSDNPLGDEGLEALAATARVDTLRSLGIARVGFGERGVFLIASSPYLAGLDRLDVRGNQIDPEQISGLGGTFGDDAILSD